jgi:hypothetical protein
MGVSSRVVPANAPHDTARAITEAWLRFHEQDLCEELDTTFVFAQKGMEAWCVIENEGSYGKLQQLLEPLRATFDIEVYATRPPEEKKNAADRDPPPSLWHNAELRTFFESPFGRSAIPGVAPRPPQYESDPDYLLKQRIMLYAEQILDWNRKLQRYGADVPALVFSGSEPGIPAEMRARTTVVLVQHLQELDKYAERLTENLTQAFPRPAKRSKDTRETERPRYRPQIPDAADQLTTVVQSTARRIYRFIHPQHHTVGLTDLREPSLLESLRTVRRMTSDLLHQVRQSGK